jgi:16S rRNA G1207 methylase RsmC
LAALPALTIVDLGCGAGSMPCALAPDLPAQQYWRLIDNDPGALEVRRQRVPSARQRDDHASRLVPDLKAALDRTLDLVTCR